MSRRSTGPSAAVRELVRNRCAGRCERCGDPLSSVVSLHHRKPRQSGGSKDPAVNSASNLMYLCGSGTTQCHGWIESHRAEAYAAGWLVHFWDDPATVPVDTFTYGPVLLTADGLYEITAC